jgi:hypothetical protein
MCEGVIGVLCEKFRLTDTITETIGQWGLSGLSMVSMKKKASELRAHLRGKCPIPGGVSL